MNKAIHKENFYSIIISKVTEDRVYIFYLHSRLHMYRYIDQVLCQIRGHESLLIIDCVIDNPNSSMTCCCFSHPSMHVYKMGILV